MTKLKSCPFCESAGVLTERFASETYAVTCSNYHCPASYVNGWDYETPEEAIQAWNNRPQQEADND